MSVARKEALERLRASLTDDQAKDLRLVIETAEVQGDYNWNGENSAWTDDVNSTLMQLSKEFDKTIDR